MSGRTKLLIGVIIGIVVVGILYMLVQKGKNILLSQSPASIGSSPTLSQTHYPTLGDLNAPITIMVFGDYQCHFCKKFAQEIEPLLIEKYVKNGKARLIWRDFPFLSPESSYAAEAAHCADEQGKFMDFMKKLHDIQPGHDPSVFTRTNLKRVALEEKLDSEAFGACFDSGKYSKQVQDSVKEGKKLGITGSPATFINDQMIDGVQEWSVFEEAMKKELNR